jgi:MFS family permease
MINEIYMKLCAAFENLTFSLAMSELEDSAGAALLKPARRARFSDAAPLLHTYEVETPMTTPPSSQIYLARATNSLPAFLSNNDEASTLFIAPIDEFRRMARVFSLAGAVAAVPEAIFLVGVPLRHWRAKSPFDLMDDILWCAFAFMFAKTIGVAGVGVFADVGSLPVRLSIAVVACAVCLIAMLFAVDFVVVLVLSGLLGFAAALAIGSLSVAPQFHPRFVAATAVGGGLAEMVVSLQQVVIYALISESDDGDERVHVSSQALVGAVIALCAVLIGAFWLLLRRSPVSMYYLSRSRVERVVFLTNRVPLPASVPRAAEPIAMHLFNVACNTAVTFFVLVLASLIAPRHYLLPVPFPVVVLGVFHSFGFLGKLMPRFDAAVLLRPRWIVYFVLARMVLFVSLIVLCISPAMIQSDLATFSIVGFLGMTNGYLTTLTLMFAPSLVHNDDKEVSQSLMLSMHALGATLGVVVAKLLVDFVPGFDPSAVAIMPVADAQQR